MRDHVASVVQLAGLAAIVVGSFALSVVVGMFVLGAALLVVGLSLDPSVRRKGGQ